MHKLLYLTDAVRNAKGILNGTLVVDQDSLEIQGTHIIKITTHTKIIFIIYVLKNEAWPFSTSQPQRIGTMS
jgi:hypothetical protein